MFLIDLIFSRFGPPLGFGLVRILPRRWAYKVGDWIVSIILRRTESNFYKAIKSNQAVIRDWSSEDDRLHTAVAEVLTNAAYGLVDWFATLAIPSEFSNLACTIDEGLIELARDSQAEGIGVILVGPHLSGFNILLMKIALEGWPVQILSFAEEEGSYQSDNIFRKRVGLNVTPISPGSLRQAYRRLRDGGFVLTGVDRPDTGSEILQFFGRPTTLPIGHARLAVRTGARIMVLAIHKVEQGTYQVEGTDFLEPPLSGNEDQDTLQLAQSVVNQMERYIKARPSEWLMFVPVWPDSVEDV